MYLFIEREWVLMYLSSYNEYIVHGHCKLGTIDKLYTQPIILSDNC